MLAWVHAAMASEQELLVSLFGGDSAEPGSAAQRAGSSGPPATGSLGGGSSGGLLSPRASSGGEGSLGAGVDGAPTIAQLMDQVFESICRPLKASRARGLWLPTNTPGWMYRSPSFR